MGVDGGSKRLMNTSRNIDLRDNNKMKNAVVIDAYSIMNRYVIGSFNTGKYVVDKFGNRIMEIYYLFIIAVRFISMGIEPIFVFDGNSPDIKAETIEHRRQIKNRAEEVLEQIKSAYDSKLISDDRILSDVDKSKEQKENITNAMARDKQTKNNLDCDNVHIIENEGDDIVSENADMSFDKYIKYLKRSYRPNNTNIQLAKLLLGHMGVRVIDAPGEADSQCAAIAAAYPDKIIGPITDDFDALLFLAPNILRMKSLGSNTFEEYSLQNSIDTLKSLLENVISKSDELKIKYINNKFDITHTNLREICCLMGTDYCPGLKVRTSNAGANKDSKFEQLLELYAKNDMCLEKVLNSMSDVLNKNYIIRMLRARDAFENALVLDPRELDISMQKPNVEIVKRICSEFIEEKEASRICNQLLTMYEKKMRNSSYSINNSTMKRTLLDYSNQTYNNNNNSKERDVFANFSSYKARYARKKKSHDDRRVDFNNKSWPDAIYLVNITVD